MVRFEVWLEYVNRELKVLLNGDSLAIIFTDYAGRAIRLTACKEQMKRPIRWSIVTSTEV